LAGHETSSHALSFALFLLASHPEVAERARREVDTLQGTPREVGALPWVQAILLETLRLYPTAWMIGRRAIADITLGSYTVEKDTLVLIPPYLLHRSSEVFADPERFSPQRWLDKPRSELPRYSYLPFGAGPRVCIGEHFAWMEMVVLLSRTLQWLEFLPQQPKPLALRPRITLAPKQEIWLSYRKRLKVAK